MAVARVLAQTDIRYDEQLWKGLTNDLYAFDHGSFWVVCRCAECVFGAGVEGYAEEDYRAQAFGDERLQEGDEGIDASSRLVG